MRRDPSDDNWQLRLLPFMVRAIAIMGLLFFASSLGQIVLMWSELRAKPATPWFATPSGDLGHSLNAELMRWNGVIALEHESLQDHMQSLNAIIFRQASLLHLGFLTGMVLCLVGAVFVLGRFQTSASALSGETQRLKLSMNTASPGLFLATLGVFLICATLFHRYQFNLPDKAVYLYPSQSVLPGTRKPTSRSAVVPAPDAPERTQSTPTNELRSKHPQ